MNEYIKCYNNSFKNKYLITGVDKYFTFSFNVFTLFSK